MKTKFNFIDFLKLNLLFILMTKKYVFNIKNFIKLNNKTN